MSGLPPGFLLPPSIVDTSPTSSPTSPLDSSTSPSFTPSSTPGLDTTTSDPPIMTTTADSGATSSATLLPVTSSSSPSHNHAGAIAGGVIGGLAVLAALVGCLLFYRYKRKSPYPVRRHGRSASIGGSHSKYDAYSVENGAGHVVVPISKVLPSRHSSTGSTATMVNGSRYERSRSLSIPGLSHEDVSSSTEDDKSFSMHGHKPMDLIEVIPPLPPLDSAPTTPTSVGFPDGRVRTRSLTSRNRAATLAKLDANATMASQAHYPPKSPDSIPSPNRRQSLDVHVLSSPPHSPTALSAREMARLSRSSYSAKRTTRKAVPKYDETEFSSPTSPLPMSEDSDTPEEQAPSPHLRVAKSREDMIAAGYEVPELNHKSSFAEVKALHYLIPDLPPPQRD